jgi:uncharacterized repeat protein (TIGR02059 family)
MLKSIRISALFLCITASITITNAQSWYDSAEVRIEEFRKGNFGIQVLDELGNPYTDSIKIELTNHEFAWGSIVPIKDQQHFRWMRAVVDQYYNFGVVGNNFKWPWVEPTQDNPTYTVQDEVLDWVDKIGIGFRGHTLIWGGARSWQMPSWTINGNLSPEQLYAAAENHITRDVGYWEGRIDEYDVINEPTHETWFAETVGDSVNWNSFKWAKAADSNAVLYANDFNIIVWGSAPAYRTMLETWIDNGAPVEGIGVQAHMEGYIDWNDVKTKLDYMAELGLPIRITEFDMKIDEQGTSQQGQANAYGTMMRTAFSHPAVNGMVFWTIWDGDAYRAGSGLFDEYLMPKIAHDTVAHLLLEKWTTKITDGSGDSSDTLSFRGFYGDYRVTVNFEGELREFSIPASSVNEDSVFVLEYADGIPATVNLLSAEITKDGQDLEMKFDQSIDISSFAVEDFAVYSDDPIAVLSFDEQDSVTVILNLDGVQFKPKQYYACYYDGDTARSKNSGLLNRFGPIQIENKLPAFSSALTDTAGAKVFVSFSEPMAENPDHEDFEIEVNGSSSSIEGVIVDESDPTLLVFTLTNAVEFGDQVRIFFSENTYSSLEGYVLVSFGPKFVENNVPNPNPPDAVNENGASLKLKAYPNPFDQKIMFENTSEVHSIQLFAADGSLLETYLVGGRDIFSIETSTLASGFYVARLLDTNYQIAGTIRLIKE